MISRAVLLGVALLMGGCVNEYPADLVPRVPNASVVPNLYEPPLDASYTIGLGDKLLVDSYYEPKLRQAVTVRTDGRMSLLLLGDIMGYGKTPKQLADELGERYEKYLERPDIVVTVTESAGLSIYVGGEVAKPGMLPLSGQLTLLQSIIQSGGFLSTANKRQVLLIRQGPDGHYRTLQADVRRVMHNEAPELYLQRHDIVYVLKTEIAEVDEFVDKYLNQIVPRWVNFSAVYPIPTGQSSGGGVVVVPGTP